ncbi:MAG: DUF5615 family PIN-like protein [Ktedonobacteraceae bacterium]|nr:DUF5615 family PIN-like protein [Ktedonobacteraceae bacterium]
MLSFLLDEQISPQTVVALASLNSQVPVVSLYTWRSGALTGTDDALVLQGAAEDGLTLVTYDLKTIPPVLVEWGTQGRSHSGVIFVDDRSISTSDFGGLARALLFCWETQGGWDWTDRIMYLKPA